MGRARGRVLGSHRGSEGLGCGLETRGGKIPFDVAGPPEKHLCTCEPEVAAQRQGRPVCTCTEAFSRLQPSAGMQLAGLDAGEPPHWPVLQSRDENLSAFGGCESPTSTWDHLRWQEKPQHPPAPAPCHGEAHEVTQGCGALSSLGAASIHAPLTQGAQGWATAARTAAAAH